MSEMDITKMTHFIPQIERMAETWNSMFNQEHFFFDFEITNALRQSVSGEVLKLILGTAPVGCDEKWEFNIFDLHTWDIFEGATSKVSYEKRRSILEALHSTTITDGELNNIVIAERWKVESMDELQTLFLKVLSEGCEGLVVKCGSGVYELRRSLLWIKMKAEYECDLLVVGYYVGEPNTKRYDFGGFACVSADNLLKVNVGGGYSDERLSEFRKNGFESYIGKIVKVRYNTVVSNDDNDMKSLFLPRFREVRFDKIVADTLDRIKK
jgi:ATP-dependent DNA ligase